VLLRLHLRQSVPHHLGKTRSTETPSRLSMGSATLWYVTLLIHELGILTHSFSFLYSIFHAPEGGPMCLWYVCHPRLLLISVLYPVAQIILTWRSQIFTLKFRTPMAGLFASISNVRSACTCLPGRAQHCDIAGC
jgi:hypothetical protein